VWADEQHWKTLHENTRLFDDADIRNRLNHMLKAFEMLQTLARGGTPDFTGNKEIESLDAIRTAMAQSHARMSETLAEVDTEQKVTLPRGPNGPFEAPAGVLLLQALTHSQYHRGQNAARMRELGVIPPMTDFVFWYALGQPDPTR
jgi:uncharacterized damage-inducible protein DinB